MFHTPCRSDSHLNIGEFTLLRWIDGEKKRHVVQAPNVTNCLPCQGVNSAWRWDTIFHLPWNCRVRRPRFVWIWLAEAGDQPKLRIGFLVSIYLAFINLVVAPSKIHFWHFSLEPTETNEQPRRILPGESVQTMFSFTSDKPGNFTSSWWEASEFFAILRRKILKFFPNAGISTDCRCLKTYPQLKAGRRACLV